MNINRLIILSVIIASILYSKEDKVIVSINGLESAGLSKRYINYAQYTIQELSIDLEEEVVKYLASIKKGKINLKKKIDKKIIAGFVLDFDDIQFDASAKKKLNKMQKQLTRNN